MRAPDRPGAESISYGAEGRRADRDFRPSPDDLPGRLMRLATGHPSADGGADLEDRHLDPADLDRAVPAGTEQDPPDSAPAPADPDGPRADDLESLDRGVADDASAVADAMRPRRTAGMRPPGGLESKAGTPFRPWFIPDGASDPWFALKQAE